MNPIIEVNGPRAQVQAEAIAKYYGTVASKEDDNTWFVTANNLLERELCYDEDSFQKALAKISAASGIQLNPDDICF